METNAHWLFLQKFKPAGKFACICISILKRIACKIDSHQSDA